jgi:2-polyprenyl-3-methyl-5-hydroxy-6-metoxy-1,4-benzoquinol methylase
MPLENKDIWNRLAPTWIQYVGQPGAIQVREEVLKPAFLSLAGSLEGKKVLDAGCGEGDMARWLAGKGATVIGIDASDVLLEAARRGEEKSSRGITYLQRDITALGDLSDFDVIVSNQVISVVPDHVAAFRELYKVLRPSGILVISITHPLFDGVGSGWVIEQDGEVRWYVDRYMARIEGRAAHGAPTYHRSLSDYISAAVETGFVLTGFSEPVSAPALSRRQPSWIRVYDQIPSLALLRCVKY